LLALGAFTSGSKWIAEFKDSRSRLIPEAAEIGCIRCGVCCRKYQPFLSLEEARIVADKLGASWESFQEQYADPRWPGEQIILIRHQNGACPFLHTENGSGQALCIIHRFKPACCREWECRMDRADCREGLKTIWNLEIDQTGQIIGTNQKLDEFAAFLRSLRA
jgi:Fe-S-cluster containining protein